MFHAFPKQYSIVASLKYVHRQHGFLFKHFKGTDKTAEQLLLVNESLIYLYTYFCYYLAIKIFFSCLT